MSRYINERKDIHQQPISTGVLLTNLGTPEAPTPKAVRKYLAEFLWDPRVVEIPRSLWWFILNGFILPFRSPKSAKLYQKIWTQEGSPLRVILEQQANSLRQIFNNKLHIVTAMRYGSPSISAGLEHLRELNARRLLIFPLYPQYSATTTGTTFDAVAHILKKWRWQPELRIINSYHDNSGYINALANSIANHWQIHGKSEKLLFSFHGLPKKFVELGDPYFNFCHKTANLIAQKLLLSPEQWAISFQSRLGKAEWLKPYTDKILTEWGAKKINSVAVICPGFSADCLETLEEIALQNQKIFKQAGGQEFQYIPALNAHDDHIMMLADLIKQHTCGWID